MINEQMLELAFQVIGGLGIFLFGMHNMSEGMQNLAGNKLKKIIGAFTNNRIMAVIVGVVATALVQSSSVTTVMVIGFVNATLMNLQQALGVILGANIGTTITGWVLVLKIGKYGLPIAGIGAIAYLFAKKDSVRFRAMMTFGIGMVFFGLELMSKGFKPLRTMPEFIEFFHKFQADTFGGIVLAACVGALMTAVVQSSSATLGITITLAMQGLITPETGVALVLGENVGTTITAFLASLGASINARRAALAHTIVNVIGVSWVITIFPIYLNILHHFLGATPSPALLLATAHTGFNVTNALLFIPLLGYLAKLLVKIIPDRGEIIEGVRATQLDSRMLETPSVAMDLIKGEVEKMGVDGKNMLINFEEILNGNDSLVAGIFKEEDRLDLVQKEISDICQEALILELSQELTLDARASINIADEFESISDQIMAATKLFKKLEEKGLKIDETDKKDLLKLSSKVKGFYDLVLDGYRKNEMDVLKIAEIQNETKATFKSIRNEHMDRFKDSKHDVYYITSYLDILKIFRRLNNYLYHISEVVINEVI